MNNDIKILDNKIHDYIFNKIVTTAGEEQKEWVRKYDVFTCRSLFDECNIVDKLKEVEAIRNQIKLEFLDKEGMYK